VEEICVNATAYDACMDVTGSDHKPVCPQRYRLAQEEVRARMTCWHAAQTQAAMLTGRDCMRCSHEIYYGGLGTTFQNPAPWFLCKTQAAGLRRSGRRWRWMFP